MKEAAWLETANVRTTVLISDNLTHYTNGVLNTTASLLRLIHAGNNDPHCLGWKNQMQVNQFAKAVMDELIELEVDGEIRIESYDKSVDYKVSLIFNKTDLFEPVLRYQLKGDPVGGFGGFASNGRIHLSSGENVLGQTLWSVLDHFFIMLSLARIAARRPKRSIAGFFNQLFKGVFK